MARSKQVAQKAQAASALPGPKIMFASQLALSDTEEFKLSVGDKLGGFRDAMKFADDQADAIEAGVAKLTTALANGFQKTASAVKDKLSTVEMEVSFEIQAEGNVLLIKTSGTAAITVKLVWDLK